MPSSSDTGVSDTLDPIAIVSDDEILSESEVYTSDTTSMDDDDFQPFALPDDALLADGPVDGDLPLIQVPAPLPLAAVPVEDLPHDEVTDDDIDLFIEGPLEGDQDGVALMDDDVPPTDVPIDDHVVPLVEIPAVVPIADPVVPVKAPMEEAPFDPFGPYSFESVASTSLHALGVQHYSSDSDSDMAMYVAPLVPHDIDPEPEVEFVPVEPAPVGPEPVIAHDPIDVPVVPTFPDPLPEPDRVDPPVMAPHVVDAPVIIPPVSDVPIDDAPALAPPVVNNAPFATHVDPRYADTLNGWIEDDDDYPPFVLPVTPPVAPVSAPIHVPFFHPHTSDVHRTDLPTTFLHLVLWRKMPPRQNVHLPTTEAELQGLIAAAIAQYAASQAETSRNTLNNNNNPPNGCTYKQFLDCKPVNFDGTGGAVAFVRWAEKTDSILRMSKCAPEQQVTYISGLFLNGALSWWNLQVQTLGEAAAYALTWAELKDLMRKKYCSRAEIQKLETEFWNLKMEGPKIAEYVQR
ncbi:calphotin-like [Helianthus annuus]|uniref:calphotin-like n=1 Tax=Helianthus annuus TaxID=4232 RepID=UPI001653123F|nr:calphotin-like [Helianthus annuus]